MINEIAEYGQYMKQYDDIREILKDKPCAKCGRRRDAGYTFECEACDYFNDTKRKLDGLYELNKEVYRFISHYFPSPGRVLRVLARYWLFHDKELTVMSDMKKKVDVICARLFAFYCDVILFEKVPYASLLKGKLNAKFMEDLSKDAREPMKPAFVSFAKTVCESLEKLARYEKPYLEQRDNAFTFYSITADAMNAGPLADGVAVELRGAEISYLLNATGYGEKRGKPDITSPTLALSLICLYRTASDGQKLTDGFLPVIMEDVNAWLGNTKASQKKSKWDENPSFDFLQIVNTSNSLKYRIDEQLLAQMTQGVKADCPVFKITDAGGKIKSELENAIKIVWAS